MDEDLKEENKDLYSDVEEYQSVLRYTWSFRLKEDVLRLRYLPYKAFTRNVCLGNQRYVMRFELRMTPLIEDLSGPGGAFELRLITQAHYKNVRTMATFHNIMADGERRLLFKGNVIFTDLSERFVFTSMKRVPDVVTFDIKLDFRTSTLPTPSESASLASSLAKLYPGPGQTPPFSDIKLVCQNKSIKCHKVILAARSKVFSEMLSQHTQKRQINSVDIKDAEPEILEKFIRYLYTDLIDMNTSIKAAFGLLALADKYEVENLEVDCQKMICCLVSTENVLWVLTQTNTVNAPHLYSFVRNFIVENIKIVKTIPEWSIIMPQHPYLMLEILNNIIGALPSSNYEYN